MLGYYKANAPCKSSPRAKNKKEGKSALPKVVAAGKSPRATARCQRNFNNFFHILAIRNPRQTGRPADFRSRHLQRCDI